MKLASKKRKSALLQNLVKQKILKTFPHLKNKDVITAATKAIKGGTETCWLPV